MSYEQPATVARRLGVGPKALRLWEDEGLIAPHRLENGWRVFRPNDIKAAWRIAALKGLGFSLREIKGLLRQGTPSFEAILAAQATKLEEQLSQMGKAKTAIANAQARLANGLDLDVDALIQLHQEIHMTNSFMNPVVEGLWEKTFSQDQLDTIAKRPFSDEDAQRVGKAWSEIIAEVDQLRLVGDPASPEALDAGRRWFALVREFTQSDPAMVTSSRAFYQKGYADPETSNHMPFSKLVWEFVSQIAGQLIARGETIT